jgi:hypothetical protein
MEGSSVIIKNMGGSSVICRSIFVPPRVEMEDQFCESYIAFVKSLANLGIPLNEPDRYGFTSLDGLLFRDLTNQRSPDNGCVSHVVSLGAQFSEKINWESDFRHRFNFGKEMGISPIRSVDI